MQCAVVQWADGGPDGEVAYYGEGYFISEDDELCWHPGGEAIFAIGIRGSTRQVLRIDLRLGRVSRLTDRPGWHSRLRISHDGNWLACSYTSPNTWGQIDLIPASGGPPETLLDLGEPSRRICLSDVELVQWRAPDAWDLEGVLVKPLGFRPGRRYPLLVDLHGGPAPGGTAYFKRVWHWLAAQGYMVFSPDFRGGQTYAWAGPLTVHEDYIDTMAGVDALIAAGHVDPDRMGIFGFSYGADLVAWLLGHTGRFAAAALICGGFDPLVSYGLAWGGGGNTILAQEIGGRPWEVPQRYHDFSPLTYLHRATTPTHLFTGDDDLVGVRMLYTWLKQSGVEVEAVHYRGDGHGFTRPGNERDHLDRMLHFFNKYVQL